MPKESIEVMMRRRDEAYATYLKLDKEIKKLRPNTTPGSVNIVGWKQHALRCITNFGEFSQTIPILQCVLHPQENLLQDKELKKKFMSNLSVSLFKLCQEKKLVKFNINGIKGDYYGLPTWMLTKDKPMPSRLPQSIKHIDLEMQK